VLADVRVQELLGPGARIVHLDCTSDENPSDRPVLRMIRWLFENAPASRMAFGMNYLTDPDGTTVYGIKPCACRRRGDLETAADLLRLHAIPPVWDMDVDLDAMRPAMAAFRRHAELRQGVARGDDPAALVEFEASLPDALMEAYPCRVVDGARISTLGLGMLDVAGGNAVGLASTLDPVTSPDPALRELLASALAAAALRDDPCLAAARSHLGLLYLSAAPDEIEPAVAATCRERGCSPADLPIEALPIPMTVRERAARLACGARGVPVPDDVSALETLRGLPQR
jgi:hypothetical protein